MSGAGAGAAASEFFPLIPWTSACHSAFPPGGRLGQSHPCGLPGKGGPPRGDGAVGLRDAALAKLLCTLDVRSQGTVIPDFILFKLLPFENHQRLKITTSSVKWGVFVSRHAQAVGGGRSPIGGCCGSPQGPGLGWMLAVPRPTQRDLIVQQPTRATRWTPPFL